jgi:hypothetical protein
MSLSIPLPTGPELGGFGKFSEEMKWLQQSYFAQYM